MTTTRVQPILTVPNPPSNRLAAPKEWLIREPDDQLSDPVPHEFSQSSVGDDGWKLIGASRRGKLHAHRGEFREDSFALGHLSKWHLMVVADGGGMCSLARVGSQLAARTAIETMTGQLVQLSQFHRFQEFADEGRFDKIRYFIIKILQQGMMASWQALDDEAQRRQVPRRELGTTFLSVLHHASPTGCLVGVLQIGDGLVAAQLADGTIHSLAKPDVGEAEGATFFLTSLPWQYWIERAYVQWFDQPIDRLVAMSDGVTNDFQPYSSYLPKLFDILAQQTQHPNPADSLLHLLRYDKPGSVDDRTLTMLYSE